MTACFVCVCGVCGVRWWCEMEGIASKGVHYPHTYKKIDRRRTYLESLDVKITQSSPTATAATATVAQQRLPRELGKPREQLRVLHPRAVDLDLHGLFCFVCFVGVGVGGGGSVCLCVDAERLYD